MATSDPISLGATGLHLQDLAVLIYKRVGPNGNAALAARYLGPWISGGPYAVGDVVYSAAVFYKNLTGANTSTAPAGDAVNWAAFVPPLALVELGDSLYQVTGLTDPKPTERWSASFALAASPSAILTTYAYGFVDTIGGPSLVANTPGGFLFETVPISVRHGSTLPVPFAHIYGLTADPTGATVAFSLAPLGGGSAISGMDGVAIFRAIDAYGNPPQWHMLVEFDWAAGDLDVDDVPSGVYVGTFTVTLPAGGGTVVSPNDRLRVNVS
jgi:hypothetical protein